MSFLTPSEHLYPGTATLIPSALRLGADPSLTDNFGNAPLFYAEEPDALLTLVAGGANIDCFGFPEKKGKLANSDSS